MATLAGSPKSIAAFLFALALGFAFVVPAGAADVARGQSLYNTFCAACHDLGGNPGPEYIKLGAGQPFIISIALRTIVEMDGLESALAASDVADLAAYLAVRFAEVPTPQAAKVVEYYHAEFDHYFITAIQDEITKLDAGVFVGWARTGKSFPVYLSDGPDLSTVCRIYIPPGKGNGHFFGRDAFECDTTMARNPDFLLEAPVYVFLYKPTPDGICPMNTVPVYRVWTNRSDANHRYTTERAVRDAMVVNGWQAEGDGPDIVTMCAPP